MSSEADLLRDGLHLALSREPCLAERFCEALFARYPASVPLFGSLHAELLVDALRDVAEHLEDVPWLEQNLAWLGARHADHGVTPDMYPWVGETLIATLRQVAGSDWTPSDEAVWRDAYEGVTELMAAGCPGWQPPLATATATTTAWEPPVATAAGWTPPLETSLGPVRCINLMQRAPAAGTA